MNQSIINITDIPAPEKVASGDECVIVGRQQGAEITIAGSCQLAGTTLWEMLCLVTKRVERDYREVRGV